MSAQSRSIPVYRIRIGRSAAVTVSDQDCLPARRRHLLALSTTQIIALRANLSRAILREYYLRPNQISPFIPNLSTKQFSDATGLKAKSIRCELQYYSSIGRHFETLCEFKLSETAIQELVLPATNTTANVWRILIHQSYVSIDGQHFEEDDDESDDSDDNAPLTDHRDEEPSSATEPPRPSREDVAYLMELHPRALVGCIRIDSLFLAANIAQVVVALDIRHLSVSLRHDRHPDAVTATHLPAAIRQYTLNKPNSTRVWDAFLKLYHRNVRAHASLLDGGKTLMYIESAVSASVLDFGYLTMLPLLDELPIKVNIELAPTKSTVNVVTDVVRLRYGHAVGHTLSVCQQLWSELEAPHLILATRYIVCNCTSSPIKFGQVDTDETLFLRSDEATFYSFRSVHADQQLRLSLETINWTAKEAVRVGGGAHDDMQLIQLLEPDQLAVVHTQKLAASHVVVVTVKGQIEFRNMSEMAFRVQYRVNSSSQTEQENNVEAVDFEMQGLSTMSLVARCDEAISQSVK